MASVQALTNSTSTRCIEQVRVRPLAAQFELVLRQSVVVLQTSGCALPGKPCTWHLTAHIRLPSPSRCTYCSDSRQSTCLARIAPKRNEKPFVCWDAVLWMLCSSKGRPMYPLRNKVLG